MSSNRKITIQDVADALNVSKTTVSRAISGKGRVGDKTRNMVLKYIEENGYVPNATAKGLAQSRTYNIGLTIPEDSALVDLAFFRRCMVGVCSYAGSVDYDVIITMTSNKNTQQLSRMIDNSKVDGVIISRTLVDDAPVKLLKGKGIPFVTIGSSNDSGVVQIDNDHETACNMMTAMLIRQGFKKMALLCGDSSHVVTINRKKGFESAMHEAGIKNLEEYIYEDVTGNLLDRAVDDILEKNFDGIICMDDSICVEVLEKLKRENVSVPEDIKVASFYNSSVLEHYTPSITSLKFDAKELGTTACKTLMNIIDGKEVADRTLLGYEISMKESTKN